MLDKMCDTVRTMDLKDNITKIKNACDRGNKKKKIMGYIETVKI